MIPRCIALCGLALALAFAASFGTEAEARHHYKHKRCIAPAMAGPQTTWVCRASEICCYDWVLRKGTCPTARCF